MSVFLCVCVCEREAETVCVCERECVVVCLWLCVCVWVCDGNMMYYNLCYMHFAHNRLLQLASVVHLVGCSLISCDAALVTEFLDINHAYQVVGADSWILSCLCCSINTPVAGVLPAKGKNVFALEAGIHATREVFSMRLKKTCCHKVFHQSCVFTDSCFRKTKFACRFCQIRSGRDRNALPGLDAHMDERLELVFVTIFWQMQCPQCFDSSFVPSQG